jgi:hypothetical protein
MDDAWAGLAGRWEDRAAHRAMLAACADLESLAEAGRRYRAVLEARPTDAVAQEMKGEILKRATIIGLSQLPRTRLPNLQAGVWPRRLLLLASAVLASILAWTLARLFLWTTP